MKITFDKICVIFLIFVIVFAGVVVFGQLEADENFNGLIEIGINLFSALLGLVILSVSINEKAWKKEEKFYFTLILSVTCFLASYVCVNDVIWMLGFDEVGDMIEIGEMVLDIITYYLIWIYIRSAVVLQEKTKKMLNALQITLIGLILVFVLIGNLLDGDITYISSILLIITALAVGVVDVIVIIKHCENKKEIFSLAILGLIPGISTLIYYSLLEVYIQYPIDILGLMLCFINVQFSRGKKEESDREFAAKIQQSVLPKKFAISDNLEIYAESRAMEMVGGDFYDFSMIDEDNIAFLMADVSGHGAAASMFMMEGISLFRGLVRNNLSQKDVMFKMNNLLCEYNEENLFITAWFGILNIKTGHLDYIDAGHGLASVVNPDGTVQRIKGRACFVLGGMDGVPYRTNEITMDEGSTLVLYTDGVVEAVNPKMELFGNERLESCLSKNTNDCKALCRDMYDAVDDFAQGAAKEDDITVMAIRLVKKNSEE